MDSGGETFTAYLVHAADEVADRAIDLPRLAVLPPERIRVPRADAPLPTFDVYELAAAEDWPTEAIYRFAGVESADPSTEL